MNKELEEAVKRLKAIKNAKLDSDSEIALFEFAENDKYIDLILNYIENSISKEVIKKKIEYKENKLKQIENDKYRQMCLQIEIDILQELLEGK